MLRETHQTAKLRIPIDGKVRMAELFCDGALVVHARRARPPTTSPPTARSSRWRQRAGADPDQRLPPPALARRAAAAHRRGGLRGARAGKRPVSAVADNHEVRDVQRVEVREARDIDLDMLFDAGRTFEERVLVEQFSV